MCAHGCEMGVRVSLASLSLAYLIAWTGGPHHTTHPPTTPAHASLRASAAPPPRSWLLQLPPLDLATLELWWPVGLGRQPLYTLTAGIVTTLAPGAPPATPAGRGGDTTSGGGGSSGSGLGSSGSSVADGADGADGAFGKGTATPEGATPVGIPWICTPHSTVSRCEALPPLPALPAPPPALCPASPRSCLPPPPTQSTAVLGAGQRRQHSAATTHHHQTPLPSLPP